MAWYALIGVFVCEALGHGVVLFQVWWRRTDSGVLLGIGQGNTVKASGDRCHQRPLLFRVVAAVCYSPTLFRVQYHCRAGS